VYLFRDAADAIIYVGKSICLRDRVRSYFAARPATRKLRRLRREIRGLEWQETGSELEALLLESRLVKQFLPRYNRMLRSFRPAAYVRVDWRDPFPRLEMTRSPGADGADYYGPFGRWDALEAAVDAVVDTLRLRTCAVPGSRLPGTRPCYRWEFGTCSAPCAAGISPDQYREAARSAADLFGGRARGSMILLEESMAAAAENLRFETAARLRDAIAFIRRASGRQQSLLSAIRRLDVLAVCPSARAGHLALFVFASGRLALQKEVQEQALHREDERRDLAREIARVEAAQEPVRPGPLTSGALDEIQIVSAWMRRRAKEGTHLALPRDPAATEKQVAAWLADLPLKCPRSAAPAPPDSES
jgi:excinuclease UvrABC nuclease subunit